MGAVFEYYVIRIDADIEHHDRSCDEPIDRMNYLFDLAGNQKFVSPWAMTFDPESRITGFTSTNNGSGMYTYDGEGRRVLKTVGGTTTLYVYDAQGNRAAEYASTVAAPPCATCYETVDTLGSVRAVTDGFGNNSPSVRHAPVLVAVVLFEILERFSGDQSDTESKDFLAMINLS